MNQFIAVAVVTAILGVGGAASAQTPGHSRQAAEHLLGVLNTYQRASLVAPTVQPTSAAAARRPRHAYESAREVANRINLLRRLMGQDQVPLPDLPRGEVMPAMVQALVQRTVIAASDLAPLYGAPALPPAPALKDGSTPGDVVQVLATVITALVSLGVPPQVPNDAAAVARVLGQEMEAVRQALAVGEEAWPMPIEPGRTPQDSLQAAVAFSHALAEVVERRPALAPSGGVVKLEAAAGQVTPQHVVDALRVVLADVRAIRSIVAPAAAPVGVEAGVGMTPSHVHSAIRTAQATLDQLR
ncbi:MAG: hypothetical protein SF002_00255 [Alphaproteobacteria bacterium]|nr:hypothetical protein [Alphaproteobacteria bacterium]